MISDGKLNEEIECKDDDVGETEQEEEPLVNLSDSQWEVVQAIIEKNRNVFFTGPAGTGKSQVLKRLKQEYQRNYIHKRVAFLAPTGVAAVNIGGQTIHSFCRIAIEEFNLCFEPEKLFQHIFGDKPGSGKTVHNPRKGIMEDLWDEVDVLIFDEVSMIHALTFDTLEYFARKFRDSTKLWGGIQIVLCGDFYQLNPIPPGEENTPQRAMMESRHDYTFVFQSNTWTRMMASGLQRMDLRDIYRQADAQFTDILNLTRTGDIRSNSHLSQMDILQQKSIGADYKSNLNEFFQEPTSVFLAVARKDVNKINKTMLQQCAGREYAFKAKYYGTCEHAERHHKRYIDGEKTRLQELLKLRCEAKVMCLVNLRDIGLFNGLIGKVVGFAWMDVHFPELHEERDFYIIKSENKCRRIEVPLVKFDTHEEPIAIPPYAFACSESRVETITDKWTDKRKYVRVRRVVGITFQLPLCLSWAMTINKAQGLSLRSIIIDCGRGLRNNAQFYVALSRAKTWEGVTLLNFHPKCIQTSKVVQRFESRLDVYSMIYYGFMSYSVDWDDRNQLIQLQLRNEHNDTKTGTYNWPIEYAPTYSMDEIQRKKEERGCVEKNAYDVKNSVNQVVGHIGDRETSWLGCCIPIGGSHVRAWGVKLHPDVALDILEKIAKLQQQQAVKSGV